MSTQPVKRLSSLEIDEVSLVDRPANQHGLVTITKRDEGAQMSGLYDEQGNELDESQLQSGDLVYTEGGEPIQLFSDDDLQAMLEAGEITQDDLVDDGELVGVGKSASSAVTGGASTLFQTGRRAANRALGEGKYLTDNFKTGYTHGRTGVAPGTHVANTHAIGARRAGAHVGRNKNAYIAAGAAGTTENARSRFRKSEPSLGEQVLSELSKALTDGDRDQVISKAMDRVAQAEEAAQVAISKAAALEAEQEFGQYVELAKSYELPVDAEELGGILMTVSKALAPEQLDTLERLLLTAASAIDFEERGSAGYSPLMSYVGEHADQIVTKSAGDVTPEQATVALFTANDEAYLDYLSEQRG